MIDSTRKEISRNNNQKAKRAEKVKFNRREATYKQETFHRYQNKLLTFRSFLNVNRKYFHFPFYLSRRLLPQQ